VLTSVMLTQLNIGRSLKATTDLAGAHPWNCSIRCDRWSDRSSSSLWCRLLPSPYKMLASVPEPFQAQLESGLFRVNDAAAGYVCATAAALVARKPCPPRRMRLSMPTQCR